MRFRRRLRGQIPAHPAERACSGTLTLTTAKPIALSRHGRKQTRVLGSLRFSVSRSRSVTLKVKLNTTARQLLRKAGHGGLRVRATAKTGAGSPSLAGMLPHIR